MVVYNKDGGYGIVGNMNKYSILSQLPSDDLRKEYEDNLKKENPKAYKEYKEWEKLIEKE
jgi:hypothetical protein